MQDLVDLGEVIVPPCRFYFDEDREHRDRRLDRAGLREDGAQLVQCVDVVGKPGPDVLRIELPQLGKLVERPTPPLAQVRGIEDDALSLGQGGHDPAVADGVYGGGFF